MIMGSKARMEVDFNYNSSPSIHACRSSNLMGRFNLLVRIKLATAIQIDKHNRTIFRIKVVLIMLSHSRNQLFHSNSNSYNNPVIF